MTGGSQPIRRRLMAMMLLTSAAGVVLACVALVGYELIEARRHTLDHVDTLARIVAANSTAALAFRDEQDAHEVLSTLRTEPSIVAAALYDAAGQVFARYVTERMEAQPYPLPPGPDGFSLSFGQLQGFVPVSERPEHRLGTLYIRSDTDILYQRLWLYALIALGAMGASILLAYVLSRILQAGISQPILALADTARAVSERGDYSVRAPSQGEAELLLLTGAFNHMLARIEQQNDALRSSLDEREVAERKLQNQLARLDLLHRTTRAIGERQDLDSIFQVILRSIEDNLPIDFGCMCVYEAGASRLAVIGVGPKSAQRAGRLGLQPGAILPIDQNGLGRCVRGTLVYEPDTSTVAFPVPQRFASLGLYAVVAAPLVVESEVFGVLIAAREQRDAFSSADCEFLRQLSEHVALAAHHVQLYTRLQKAYDDLQESQQTLLQQERLRALGQMASGIAHDINNAISPVTLYTESLLEREPNLSERARDYLRIIQRSIDDVGQTVARMREFYRQRDRQSDLVPLSLNPLVEQVVALTRARWADMAMERGVMIDVRTELAGDLPQVLGTESDIRDALTNLIFNAVDAMPDGGRLTVRTHAVPWSGARAATGGMATAELQVSDTGIGMDDQTRRRCLEPFFTTKGERGTGMGLAMVYGMAQRHGAHIDIESALGKGTTVRLRFEPAPQSMKSEVPRSATAAPASLHLLVIDDDPLVTQSLYYVLRNDGHTVTAADGGQAGIDAFTVAHESGKRFDVVITDLGMPYVDGRAVAAAVKSMSPQTPVVLLTGWGQRLSTEHSVPAHVDRLMSKPPKLPDLRRTLAELTSSAAESG